MERHQERVIDMAGTLSQGKPSVVGTKQVLRALEEGRVERAYVAGDADLILTKRVVDRCYERNIPCTQIETMEELGRGFGIAVRAAAAAILK